jgi:hypothetical protein
VQELVQGQRYQPALVLPLSSQILSGAGAGAGTGAAVPACIGVTFEHPDIAWCRFRSWYRGSGTSRVLALSSLILSGAGDEAGTCAMVPS